ncbi:ABC transporter permease [Verminephrobacter aporrectodeae subsp. tuberculatae]|uniref:ABC transporter permease n=1 Tax=Verminephrobacter aporrectodeae TaxID=1110389 RepID=UPI00224388E0|nr:ABC transporter permease [Verminephrobacter aporrectodeae]MCW8165186.1 ABC transporter permease [Verminephrobacter aporrectodeae subsp. tuberculatae]MCW8168296.1 ABC transporter permease [Verminephrobacter aporrectodeae subsp. tuberculatae]
MRSLPTTLLDAALDHAPWLVLCLLLAAFGLVDARIVARENLWVVVQQATPIALLGLAVFWVLLTGEIDLSAGHSVTLSAVSMGTLLSSGVALPAALGVGFACCAVVGCVNGLLVAALRIPSFIATLASMLLLQGATLIVATTGTILVLDPRLRAFAGSAGAGVSPMVAFTAAVALGSWWLARWTGFGLKTFALGSHPARAELAGVRVQVQKFGAFLLSSVYVFLAAAIIIARVPVVNPGVGGTGLLLDAIAAAVIGGTSLLGGRGTVGGVVCGALTMSLLTAALRVLGVEPSSLDLYKGAIIVLILLGDRGLHALRALAHGQRHG